MPIRPPPKPFKRANLSLEQNPFEYSFSQSSTSVVPNGQRGPHHKPPSPKGNTAEGGQKNGATNDANGATTSNKNGSPKPVLPPLSSLAEPATENSNSFPWGFSAGMNDHGSLRSGPLSPAMLPGPRGDTNNGGGPSGSTAQHHQPTYFDGHPSLSFRTGLTPGIGRTGLTPLVGGPASFPPPSPNTAAFLAMVTQNGGGGASAQAVNTLTGGATITPNTLSALTGHLISQNDQSNGQNAPHHGQQQSGAHHQQHRLSVPSYPPVSHSTGYGTSDVAINPSQGYAPSAIESYQGAAQHATAAAANGLFLLSQAHQELTKREEQQQAEAAAAAANNSTNGGGGANGGGAITTRGAARRTSTVINTTLSPVTVAPAGGHSKRKSTEAARPAAQNKRLRGSTTGSAAATVPHSPVTRQSGRKKAATQPTYGESPPDMDDDGSMDDDEMMEEEMARTAGTMGGTKKYETEEEKRKNFLERNRQAALKCRQRKKAWLTELQKRVEFLTSENERLQGTIVSMRDEVTRLSAVVVAHRACGLGGVVVPGYGAAPSSSVDNHHNHNHNHHNHPTHNRSPADNGNGNGSDISMMSPRQGEGVGGGGGRQTSPISVAPVSVPVSVPPPNAPVSPVVSNAGGGGGYGY